MINPDLIVKAANIHLRPAHVYTNKEYHQEIDDAFIAGAKWVLEQIQWISVQERLPEKPFPAVLGTDGKSMFVCNYTTGRQIDVDIEDGDAEDFGCEEINEQFFLKPGWYELTEQMNGYYNEAWLDRKVTHWIPLPEPPKTEQK